MRNRFSYRTNYVLVLLLTVFITYLFFRFAFSFLLPLFLAYSVAKLLLPLHRKAVKKLHLKSSVISGVLVCGFLFVCGILLFFFCRLLYQQGASFLGNFTYYMQKISTYFSFLCDCCDNFFHFPHGTLENYATTQFQRLSSAFGTDYLPKITSFSLTFGSKMLSAAIAFFFLLFMAFFLLKDWDYFVTLYQKNLFYKEVSILKEKVFSTGVAWIKTQLILVLITSGVLSCGFFLLKNPYALLLGIAIGILDALPLVGSGVILIPWAIIDIFSKDYKSAAILIGTFFACQLIREIMEPRLLGKRTGILPLYTLIAVFLGMRLFGVAGVLYGPLSLVVIQTVMDEYSACFTNS